MYSTSTGISNIQQYLLEDTRQTVSLLGTSAPQAFRETLAADSLDPESTTLLLNNLARTKDAFGSIIQHLTGPALLEVRDRSDALFALLECACKDLSQIAPGQFHSRSFQVVTRDNLNQIGGQIASACQDLANAMVAALEGDGLLANNEVMPVSLLNESDTFLTRFRKDLENHFPSTLESRIMERNLRNTALALIPGVGVAAEVLSAQSRFRRGLADNDIEVLDSARRELVGVLMLPCAAAATGVIDSGAFEKLLKVASFLSLTRIMTNDTPIETDLIGPIADLALKIPGMKEVIDTVLIVNPSHLAINVAEFCSQFLLKLGQDFESHNQ